MAKHGRSIGWHSSEVKTRASEAVHQNTSTRSASGVQAVNSFHGAAVRAFNERALRGEGHRNNGLDKPGLPPFP